MLRLLGRHVDPLAIGKRKARVFELRSRDAESYADEVRLSLLRPGEQSELSSNQRVYDGPAGG